MLGLVMTTSGSVLEGEDEELGSDMVGAWSYGAEWKREEEDWGGGGKRRSFSRGEEPAVEIYRDFHLGR